MNEAELRMTVNAEDPPEVSIGEINKNFSKCEYTREDYCVQKSTRTTLWLVSVP